MTRRARAIISLVTDNLDIPVDELVSAVAAQIDEEIQPIQKQRDDLLIALREVVALSDRKHNAWHAAHAAIARAEARI